MGREEEWRDGEVGGEEGWGGVEVSVCPCSLPREGAAPEERSLDTEAAFPQGHCSAHAVGVHLFSDVCMCECDCV